MRENNKKPLIRRLLLWGAFFVLAAAGAFVFREKSYLFISFALCAAALFAFTAALERSDRGRRAGGRAVLVAVMVALSVVGRLIPFFNPITALTVITAVYLGCEAGFLTGAMAALLSNFIFGQGPWTPFQMLAWGVIGVAAGLLSGVLKKSRVALCVFGTLAGVLYSLLMDVFTVIWYNGGFDLTLYLAALVTALPYTLLYAVSNILFLLLMAAPFGKKLERVKLKYGI